MQYHITFVETSHYLKQRGRKEFEESLFLRSKLVSQSNDFEHPFTYIYFFLPINIFSFLLNQGGQYAHYYYTIKNIGHHAHLKENEHLFRYRA